MSNEQGINSSDTRTEERIKMQGDFPGVLVDPESGLRVAAMMRDISTTGVGLITNQSFELGETVSCTMGTKEVELELRWIHPFGFTPGLYTCGFKSKDLKASLMNIKDLQR